MKTLSIVVLFFAGSFLPLSLPGANEKVKAALAGSLFDQVGKVTFYVGQPCTSQIMFVFHAARSTSAVWLAAPMQETRILTEAAKHQRRVHATGQRRQA